MGDHSTRATIHTGKQSTCIIGEQSGRAHVHVLFCFTATGERAISLPSATSAGSLADARPQRMVRSRRSDDRQWVTRLHDHTTAES